MGQCPKNLRNAIRRLACCLNLPFAVCRKDGTSEIHPPYILKILEAATNEHAPDALKVALKHLDFSLGELDGKEMPHLFWLVQVAILADSYKCLEILLDHEEYSFEDVESTMMEQYTGMLDLYLSRKSTEAVSDVESDIDGEEGDLLSDLKSLDKKMESYDDSGYEEESQPDSPKSLTYDAASCNHEMNALGKQSDFSSWGSDAQEVF
jgi:hypothetical protein